MPAFRFRQSARRASNAAQAAARAIVGAALAAVAAVPWAVPAQAHDFWLGADPAVSGRQTIRLWVGHQLDVQEELGHEGDRIVSAVLVRDGHRVDVSALGRDGDAPLFTLPATSGALLFALERRRVPAHTMERSKFDGYLRDEGLGEARALLARAPARDGEVERYSRYLKLWQGATMAEPSVSEQLGHRFEIVLPDGLAMSGATTRVCLRFDSAPLPGRMITALSGDSPNGERRHRRSRISAGDGCADLELPRADFHLLRSVHLRQCRDDCGAAQWESFWAAYSIQP
jgi:hypothetical protein